MIKYFITDGLKYSRCIICLILVSETIRNHILNAILYI